MRCDCSFLREPDRRRRDEKRPFPLRTKNCHHNPKQPLDRKSPIQVRIHSPPAKCQANSAKLKNARGHARKANKQFELLGTTMIVNAMHRQAHLFAIKPEHAGENPNAFSARTRRIAGIGAKLLTRRDTLAGDQTTGGAPSSSAPPDCRADTEPACRGPRLHGRRLATETSACRRSEPPSHQGASDCSAAGGTDAAVARSPVRILEPNTGRFRKRRRAPARRAVPRSRDSLA
jgi:hypothetical protein